MIQFQMIYTKLEHLGSARVADGRYSFTSDSNVCSGQNCFDFELGIFEVQLQDPGQATKNQYDKHNSLFCLQKNI